MLLQKEVSRSVSITSALQVHGWQHLDAVLLAALATEFPVLLIGAHGTAKTLIVERLSRALSLEFRHYNASLINYDDVVGIPMPNESLDHLHFVTTPGAIWDAEFVFFDEISRCRPDLQNKMFPIIHERRVIGMDLSNLRFRWSAMNPPSPDHADLDMAASDYYLGSEPLDPALTDRFPIVIPVPSWRDLSREDQRALVSLNGMYNAAALETPPDFDLGELVIACRDLIPTVQAEYADSLPDYILSVMDLLENASLPQSPRRARMLSHAIVAIHAARIVLYGDDVDLADSAELALLYGLPQNATDVPPTPASIVALHRQAWEVATMLDDEVWRQILSETNPYKRIVLADDLQLDDDQMSRLVTQALAADESETAKVSVATAIYLRFRRYRQLDPAAWEPLAKLAARVLLPRVADMTVANNSADYTLWQAIKPWVLEQREKDGLAPLLANYVLGGFPELWRQHDWQESVKQFEEHLSFFGIEEF